MVIHGVTREGKLFRPRNWAERILGSVCKIGKNGKPDFFSQYISMKYDNENNCKSLIVHEELEHENLPVYEFIVQFMTDNNLRVTD